jgi:hypothetical protein
MSAAHFLELLPQLQRIAKSSSNAQYQKSLKDISEPLRLALLECLLNLANNEELFKVLSPSERRYFRAREQLFTSVVGSAKPDAKKLELVAKQGPSFLKRALVPIDRYFQS